MKTKLEDQLNDYEGDDTCKEYTNTDLRNDCDVTYDDANDANKNCDGSDTISMKWSHNLCYFNTSDGVAPNSTFKFETKILNKQKTSVYSDWDSHMTNPNFANKTITHEFACGEGWMVVPGTTELVKGATKNNFLGFPDDDVKRCVGPGSTITLGANKLHRARCVKVDDAYSNEGLLKCCFGETDWDDCPPYHCRGSEQNELTTNNCRTKIIDFCTQGDNLQTEEIRCKGTTSDFYALAKDDWKNAMGLYCDGDNLKKDACITWCDADINKCKAKLDNYCSDKMGSEEHENICACFYPPEVYENYKNSIREKVELDSGVTASITIDSLLTGGPYCYYDKCGNADLIDFREKCKDITLSQCIQNVKIGEGGSINDSNVEVTNEQNCDINIKNDTTCDSDEDCAQKYNGDTNYTCVSNQCKFTGNTCSVSSDCTNENEECRNGICVTLECSNTNPCYNRDGIINECNSLGKCVTTSCDNDEDCINKFVSNWAYCKNNICKERECFIDENCTGSDVCVQGRCLPFIEENKYPFNLSSEDFYILVAIFSLLSAAFISLLAVTRPLIAKYNETSEPGKPGKPSLLIILLLTVLVIGLLTVGFIGIVFIFFEVL